MLSKYCYLKNEHIIKFIGNQAWALFSFRGRDAYKQLLPKSVLLTKLTFLQNNKMINKTKMNSVPNN